MRVLKFGGTSVATAPALQQAARIIKDEVDTHGPCVVVASATAGTTNRLLQAATLAPYQVDEARRTLDSLAHEHQALAQAVLGGHEDLLATVLEQINNAVQRALDLAQSMYVLHEWTDQSSDAFVATGELLSTAILSALLQRQSVPVVRVAATELLQTNDSFGAATVDMVASTAQTRECLLPLIRDGYSVVTQGFIGATADGRPTTLGRGGSDASAAILGACIAAEEVQIWTDVSGVYSADPRLIPAATPLPMLHVGEIRELALYGAKVVHPDAILPAINAGVRVRILNTFAPDDAGTIITSDSITSDTITTSALHAVSIAQNCALVDEADSRPCLLEARTIDHVMKVVRVEGDHPDAVAVLCIVGPDVVHTTALAALGAALQHLHVKAVVTGTSPWAVFVVVPQEECLRALQQVHDILGA